MDHLIQMINFSAGTAFLFMLFITVYVIYGQVRKEEQARKDMEADDADY